MRLRRVVLALSAPAEPPPAIRAARKADLPRIAEIDAACFQGQGYPPFVLRQALDVHGDLLRVAEASAGEIAGYVLRALAAGSGVGWIVSMAVRPTSRGHGLAGRLLADAVGRLRAAGAGEILLTVDPENRAATLYGRAGFVAVDEEADYFGPGERRVVMRLGP